ncbi:MAG: efflux RND transporter periplasmic adaptor subunit [Gemmatimonadaceae bacterium]
MNRSRSWLAALAVASIGACSSKKSTQPTIQTATVTRRDIVVTAQATGTVEPVDTVAVKSQASGLIIAMPVEVGSQVKPGQVIAQIDTRNLTNDYQRTAAVQQAAEATLRVDTAALARSNSLFTQKVITADEHEAAVVAAANARSALTSAQTNLRTAQQNLEYATVRAEVGGTVISKGASVGSVATSATSNVGGGSTLITIANLQRVRMRALVNETDIGNVHAGMPVTVTIDAFPNRQFTGQVEKVEPQAVIQQSVTMFPVLVSLANPGQELLPGMNGEVSIVTQQRQNVLAVPNDAVRGARDLAAAATALSLNPDSIRAMMQASRRSGAGGAASGRARGAGNGRGGVGGSGAAGTGGSPLTVSDTACHVVTAALAKVPNAQAQLDSLRGAMRMGGADTTVRTRMAAIYQRAGVNADTARACMRRAGANRAGGAGTGASGGTGGAGGGAQVVFVKEGLKWAPQGVRLGVSDFDYSEVLSGVKEGDAVALLGAAVLQAQRDQASDRARAITGNGLPGSGATGGGGGARGGGGAGGGGRP